MLTIKNEFDSKTVHRVLWVPVGINYDYGLRVLKKITTNPNCQETKH
jgi:hypothetical protein